MTRRGAARLLAIEPGEGGDVARLSALFFLLGSGYVVGQAAGYALFVDRFGARHLPFAFLVMPFFGMVVTTANLRAGARVGLPRLLMLDVAAMTAIGAAVWIGLGNIGVGWLLFLLPVWDAGVNSLGNLVVWSATSRLLDVRQAKRLAPVVAAGRSTALVAGGFLVPVVVHEVGTRDLYLLQAAAFAAALAVIASLVRRRRDALGSVSVGTRRPRPLGGHAPRRYLTAVFAVVFLSMLAYVLVRNIFLDRGAAQFPQPSDYAAQIGFFNACQGVVTLLTALLLSGRFLRRFGLRGGLLALPVALVALCAPLVLFDLSTKPQFAIAAASFVVCGAMMFSVRTPSMQLLYQPLEPHARMRAVSTGDGVIEPLALAGAALVLLLVTRLVSWGATGMATAVLIIACLLIAASSIAFRGYRNALDSALSRRWLRGGGFDISDASTRASLEEDALRGGIDQVVAVIGVLEDAGQDVGSLLARLVEHADPEVRAFVLGRYLDADEAVPLAAVRELVAHEASPDVRAVAARLAARAGVLPGTRGAWDDPDPTVRCAIVAGMLESAAPEAHEHAAAILEQWASSADPAERVSAGRAAAMAGGAAPCGLVSPLITDGDLDVRNAALAAAAARQSVTALPLVVDALSRRGSQAAAADALVIYGATALGPLASALQADDAPGSRQRALRVIGRIEHPGAISVLAATLRHEDRWLRGRAASLLASRDFRLAPADLEAAVEGEIAMAVQSLGALVVVNGAAAGGAREVLTASLWDVVREARDQVLRLLALADDYPVPRHISRAVTGKDVKQRAYALEALDTTLPPALRARVLPMMSFDGRADELLRVLSRGARVSSPVDAAHALRSLADGSDRWLATVARACSDTGPGASLEGAGMTPIIERVLFLKRVDAFSTLPSDTLADIAQVLHEVRLDADETLFHKGDDGTSMYLVVEGTVQIHDAGTVLGHVRRHEMFGELALLDAEPRSASATAEEPTVLYRLDQEPFYELVSDRPDVLRKIMRTIVRTLRARTADLAEMPPRGDLSATRRP